MSTRTSARTSRSRPSGLDKSPVEALASPSRSPARTKRSSPARKSPARKSPARKSPSRNTASKFPARKSPSRTTKEATEASAQKSPGTRPSIKNNVTIEKRETRSRFKSDYTIKDISSNVKTLEIKIGDIINGLDKKDFQPLHGLRNRKVEDVAIRRSNRIRGYHDNETDRSKSYSKSVSGSLEFSDGDNSEDELKGNNSSTSITRKLATPLRESISKLTKTTSKWQFGGRIGTTILLPLLPIAVIVILATCYKTCSLRSVVSLQNYKGIVWYSIFASTIVVSQAILQAFLSYVPILGPKVDGLDGSPKKYCFNGFFATVFTATLIFTLDFFKIINSNLILNEYPRLALSSYILAVVLSIVLYARSHNNERVKQNPYGNSGYVLYDFWMGREIHPSFGKLEVKIWLSRISNISAIILTLLIFKHGVSFTGSSIETVKVDNIRDFINKIEYQPTILLFSMMQLVYLLNYILKEHKMTSTFFWHSEGVGYMQTVASCLYPFFFTTVSKFIVDNKVSLATNALVTASVLYALGLLVMLSSNNIKYEFRRNSQNQSFAKMETISTFIGKKLLVSGIWGVVRHPNYTGDILVHLALAVPGLLSWSVSAAPPLLTVLVLLHRAWRDHTRCQRLYGAAWQRYCKRVPSALVPKII